eukprot:6491908-Amphidinium_carterae.1
MYNYERQPHIFGAQALQYRQGTGIATVKTPPSWSPELATGRDYQYTLREWQADVELWQSATEVPTERQAPLLVLALGGSARRIGEQIPAQVLRDGAIANLNDGLGQIHHSGTALLFRALQRKFPENEEADMLKCGMEFLGFRPRAGESLDGILLRFEMMMEKANRIAHLDLSWQFKSWIILSILRVPAKKWAEVLEKLNHQFPRSEDEFTQLKQYLLREHKLEDTLRLIGGQSMHGQQSYYQDASEYNEDEHTWLEEGWSTEMESTESWLSNADTTHAGAWYGGDEGEGQEPWNTWNGDNHSDFSETDSEQEQYEDQVDHYSPDRLEAERTHAAQNPNYAAELWWTARKALRRHRAATGRLHHHRFRRHHYKGKGKGKGKGNRDFVTPFGSIGSSKKGKGKGKPSWLPQPAGVLGSGKMGKTGKYYLEGPEADPYSSSWMSYEHDQAYATAKKGGKGKKPGSGTCHLCGQPGHWKRECPHRHSMGQSKGTTSSPSTVGSAARPGPQQALLALAEHAEPPRIVYEELPGAYHTNNEEAPLILGRELPGEECEPPNMSVFMTNIENQGGQDQEQEFEEPPDHIIQLTGSIDLGQLAVQGELRVHGNMGHIALRPAQGVSMATANSSSLRPAVAKTTDKSTSAAYNATSERRRLQAGDMVNLHGVLGVAVTYPGPKASTKNAQLTTASNAQSVQQLVETDTQNELHLTHHGYFVEQIEETVNNENAMVVTQHEAIQSAMASATTSASVRHVQKTSESTPSHERAKLSSMESLLPDTGAVENLVGARSAQHMTEIASQIGARCRWTRLACPKTVSGVGGSSQTAEFQIVVEGNIGAASHIKYAAPVVGGSSSGVPPLLGLRELSNSHCVYLPRSKQLKVVSDEHLIQWPSGTKTIHLSESPSGHLLLPFLQPKTSSTWSYPTSSTPHADAQRHQQRSDHDLATNDHNHIFARQHQHVQQQHPEAEELNQTSMLERQLTPHFGSFTSSTSKDKDTEHDVLVERGSNHRQRQQHRREIMQAAEAVIVSNCQTIPKAHTRTNVYGNNSRSAFTPRSVLLGIHTTRGVGITRATEDNQQIVAALHQLASSRPPSRVTMPYSAIQLTISEPGQGLPCHTDGHNATRSDIIALGTFEGGQLWLASNGGTMSLPSKLQPLSTSTKTTPQLKGTLHDINHRWLTFDGHQPHATTSHTGFRISIIYYSPQNVHQLPTSLYHELRQHGFPIPTDAHILESWTMPLTSSVASTEEHFHQTVTSSSSLPVSSTSTTVAIIAEQRHLLGQALVERNCNVMLFSHAHITTRRQVPHDLEVFMADLRQQRPHLLWIQYHGQQHPGRRAQVQLLHRYFQELVQAQLHAGGQVIIESRNADLPIREQVMQSMEWRKLLPHFCQARVCTLAMPLRPQRCTAYLALSSFPVASCSCTPQCKAGQASSTTLCTPQQGYAAWVHYLLSAMSTASSTLSSSTPPMSAPSSQEAYPTDAAIRAKQRKQQLQQSTGPSTVSVSATRSSARRTPPQEHHYDDCGSDFELIAKEADVHPSFSFLFASEPDPHAVRAHLAAWAWTSRRHLQAATILMVCPHHIPTQQQTTPLCLMQMYWLSTVVEPIDLEVAKHDDMHLMELRDLTTEHWLSLATPTSSWQPICNRAFQLTEQQRQRRPDYRSLLQQPPPDVMEVFGGAAGVTRLALTQRLTAAPVADLLYGVDVTNPRCRHELVQYVRLGKPKVVVLSPPCTAFSNWSHLNRIVHPKAYRQSLMNGSSCSSLAAQIAEAQLRNGRHFLLENPQGSELFKRPEWQRLQQQYSIQEVSFPQCAAGLRSPSGAPILKRTTLWSSSPHLVRAFQQLRCTCTQEHKRVEGSELGHPMSTWSAQWPPRMCHLIVEGIKRIMQKEFSFPIHAHTRHTMQQVRPLEAEDGLCFPAKVRDGEFGCQACRCHRAMTHPSHTRNAEGEFKCKFPLTLPIERHCPGCIKALPYSHAAHTLEPGDCKALSVTMRIWRGRSRVTGGPEAKRGARPAQPPRQLPPGAVSRPGTAADEQQETAERAEEEQRRQERAIAELRVAEQQYEQEIQQAIEASRLPATPAPIRIQEIPLSREERQRLQEAQRASMDEYARTARRGMQRADVPQSLPIPGTPPPLPPSATAAADGQHTIPEDSSMSRTAEEGLQLTIPAAATPRGRGPDHTQRMRRSFQPGISQTEETMDEITDWRMYDIRRALQLLHSDSPRVRMLTLRRLHTRWYHCGKTAMRRILVAAGVHGPALTEMDSVIATCNICRTWSRPEARTIHAHRVVPTFNMEVQADLLYYRPIAADLAQADEQFTILHAIDVASRFSMAQICPTRSERDLCSCFDSMWIAYFGPPNYLIIDEETGFHASRYAADWAQRQHMQLKFKAPRQEAAIIERHNQILRQQLHVIETQLQQEGQMVPLQQTLSQALFAKNSLTTHQGLSPYNAVMGIQPPLLPPIELEGEHTLTPSRLREVAIESIVQESQRARMQRALRHRTRKPIEMKNLSVGMPVDIWYEPTNKETGGWRGPATVASIQESEGNITVRYQGRTLDRRAQEVREHIIYHVFFAAPHQETWEALCRHINTVNNHILVGHILVDIGWQLTSATANAQGATLHALLTRIASMLGFASPFAVRISIGQTSATPLPEYEQCEVWCWHPDDDFVQLQLWMEAPQTAEQRTFLLPTRSWAQLVRAQDWQRVIVLQWWHGVTTTATTTTTPTTTSTTIRPQPQQQAEPVPLTGSSQLTPARTSQAPSVTRSSSTSTSSRPPPPSRDDKPETEQERIVRSDWHRLPPPPVHMSAQTSPMDPPSPPSGPLTTINSHLDMPIDEIGDTGMRATPSSSEVTRHTRSRSHSMTPMDVATGPRPPPRPPDHPAGGAQRGRSLTQRTPTVAQPMQPPPPNHIDQLDVIDMLGLPQPPAVTHASRSRSRELPVDSATTAHPAPVPEQSPGRDPSPASTRPYTTSPTGSVASTRPYADHGEPDDPLLPLQQTVSAHNDDDDDDEAPTGAAAAATTSAAAAAIRIATPASKRKEQEHPDSPPKKTKKDEDEEEDHADAPPRKSKKEDSHEKKGDDDEQDHYLTDLVDELFAAAPCTDHEHSLTDEEMFAIPHYAIHYDYDIICGWEQRSSSTMNASGRTSNPHHEGGALAVTAAWLDHARTALSSQPDDLVEVIFTRSDDAEILTGLSTREGMADTYVAVKADDIRTSQFAARSTNKASQKSPQRSQQLHGVIKREMDSLTAEDMVKHRVELQASREDELGKLFKLDCFERVNRSQAVNILDARWIYRFKIIDGRKHIKSRMTLRGFRESHMSFETFAGTAARHSQRIVGSMCCCHKGWTLESLDISSAFARGLEFSELSKLTGTPLRVVELDLAAEDIAIVRMQPGFEDYNPLLETLRLRKAVYGLKDAPRAWELRLKQILAEYGLVTTVADSRLYYLRRNQQLQMICSTHVDDLKCSGVQAVLDEFVNFLEKRVGKLKRERRKFVHTGIQHDLRDNGLYMHQEQYAAQLHPAATTHLHACSAESELSEKDALTYLSLLGGLAWLSQTRADIMVYIQCLQRHGHKPRKADLTRMNTLIKYVRKHRCGLWYPRMSTPEQLWLFSDAAFKAKPEEASGLALKGMAVGITETSQKAGMMKFHLIEFQSNRQRRVVRSTFAAEINSLLDGTEKLYHIQFILHQLLSSKVMDARGMKAHWTAGALRPFTTAAVDARSVYDALAASDMRVPLEDSLLLHLTALRDDLSTGKLQTLAWLDTRIMLADALTKGSVDRAQMRLAADSGQLNLPADQVRLHQCREVEASRKA